MIQPYFKPDVNPTTPAFAVFYNGYFQERSKMNMQMMDLMLRQASPEYLTKMIDRTQKNIEELQKTRAKIIQGSQKDQMELIKLQTRMQFEADKVNAGVNRQHQEMLQKAITGGGKRSQGRYIDPSKAATEQDRIEAIKNQYRSEMLSEEHADHTSFLKKMKLRPQDTPEPYQVALALEVFDENKNQITNTMNKSFSTGVKQILDRQMTSDRNRILANKYPNTRGSIVPTTASTPSEDRADELGFTLPMEDAARAEQFIRRGRDGQFYIDANYSELQKRPYFLGETKKGINEIFPNKTKEEIDEILEKRLKQKILQEKKGYVGAPKVKMPSQKDLESTLKYIDDQLANESSKLQGYLTRYDIGQRDVLEQIFDPFESNYRTENLFKRKSPEVLRQEEEIREMQYATREDTPTGYENIKYNTEYQAPGGLNFGITKVGQEEIPYIFEGDKPYEITKTDPSYSLILDLLAEQDRILGGK
tara:strand:+ start:529 stop:1959 length:1431 start_codon:yes stop_codon:yes gene_type:complete